MTVHTISGLKDQNVAPHPEIMFRNIEFEIDLFSNQCETIQTTQHTIKQLIYKTVFNKNYVEMTVPAIYNMYM